MAKMISTSSLIALVLCSIATFSFGQDTTAASTDVSGGGSGMFPWFALLTNPQDLTLDKQCPPLCAASCNVMKLSCVDVPGVINCDDLMTQCSLTCDKMCTCFTDCTTNCAATNACSGDDTDTIGQLSCVYQRTMCGVTCQGTCPTTALYNSLMTSLMTFIGQVQALLQSVGMAPPAQQVD